jgi:uncharacterized protein (UPF0335 family)
VAREVPVAEEAAPRVDALAELLERVERLERELAALKQSLGAD